jgi:hypothetical protein
MLDRISSKDYERAYKICCAEPKRERSNHQLVHPNNASQPHHTSTLTTTFRSRRCVLLIASRSSFDLVFLATTTYFRWRTFSPYLFVPHGLLALASRWTLVHCRQGATQGLPPHKEGSNLDTFLVRMQTNPRLLLQLPTLHKTHFGKHGDRCLLQRATRRCNIPPST